MMPRATAGSRLSKCPIKCISKRNDTTDVSVLTINNNIIDRTKRMNNPLSTTVKVLPSDALTLTIAPEVLGFNNTAELIVKSDKTAQEQAWIAQAEAKTAAEFGLNIQQKGFNLLALGEPGTGRTTLMLSAMNEVAAKQAAAVDVVALYTFDLGNKPLFLKLNAGLGLKLKKALDQFVRKFAKELSKLIDAKDKESALAPLHAFVKAELSALQTTFAGLMTADDIYTKQLTSHFIALEKDIIECLDQWQPALVPDADNNLEALLSESFFGRYRVNVLVSAELCQANGDTYNAPVIYDNDPSLQSLFGGIESASDSSSTPEFMRLRAGNLLRADGGCILLHLRDFLADEQNGSQLLEKLHRFLRNGTLQIEDLSGGSGQGGNAANAPCLFNVSVKVVLVATREDYYALLDEKPEFFSYFPIKVEFAEKVKASAANYAAYAAFIAQRCEQFACNHFTAAAVAALLQAMHRHEEDQLRLSTNFAALEKIILESAAAANLRGATFVQVEDVKAAITRKYTRHSYIEAFMRDSIVDNELMITVQGEAIGQINGLTHIDLADASFGSPVRITANCFPGSRGVLTIDREVAMSGPTHDKGVMILQSWLQQKYAYQNPLSFTASLVFEQEYNGVDGDSASCAELFAILSALTQTPLKLGIAVTGALNQHGEVLPVGGLNEKIEGYFRVCKALGLNGQQGVLMPSRNQPHLILSDEVIEAVNAGLFSIATMQHVEEGLAYLTGKNLADLNTLAEARLQEFKSIVEQNLPKRH